MTVVNFAGQPNLLRKQSHNNKVLFVSGYHLCQQLKLIDQRVSVNQRSLNRSATYTVRVVANIKQVGFIWATQGQLSWLLTACCPQARNSTQSTTKWAFWSAPANHSNWVCRTPNLYWDLADDMRTIVVNHNLSRAAFCTKQWNAPNRSQPTNPSQQQLALRWLISRTSGSVWSILFSYLSVDQVFSFF